MYIQFSYGQLKALFTTGKLQKIIMLNYKNTTKENNRRSHERNLVHIGSFVFLEIVATCFIALVFKFQHSGQRLNVKNDI